MWQELKSSDDKLLTLYQEVMAKMDKFYVSMTVDHYKKYLVRGDRGFYWTDGKINLFMMFHWNGSMKLWCIQCVGAVGTDDFSITGGLVLGKIKEFMSENNLIQVYAKPPKTMDSRFITDQHNYCRTVIGDLSVDVQKETTKEYICSLTLLPTTKTGI